ncbi:MAG: cytochrome c family protein [Alphaproteobacteria bacterium]
MFIRHLLFVLALAMFGLGGSAMADGDAALGEKVFRKCKACHTLENGGKHKIGPNLHGLIGRISGTAKGYKYSKAMKAAGIVWTEANLAAYLAGPKTFVPGNKMPFPGLKKAEDRANVIAYLKSMADE